MIAWTQNFNMKKSKEVLQAEKSFVRDLEIALMCVMNIVYRFKKESKMKNPPLAIITEKELFDSHKSLWLVYVKTCNDFNIKHKSLDEINNSFQTCARNEP